MMMLYFLIFFIWKIGILSVIYTCWNPILQMWFKTNNMKLFYSPVNKVFGTMVSEEGPIDSVLRHEMKNPSLLISLKKVQLKQCFLLLTPWAKFIFFIE